MAGMVSRSGTALTDLDNNDEIFSKFEFLEYIGTKLHTSVSSLNKNFRVFWNEEDDESDSYQTLFSNVGASLLPPPIIKDKAKIALQHLDLSFSLPIVAQFWVPVTIEGRRFLSTSDQPFGLTSLRKGLCWYRKHCLNYFYNCSNTAADEVITGEGTRESVVSTGPPSRVFFNGLPEYSPNLEFYSKTEYPMRDEAMRHRIKNYMAVPVFGPISQECIGVLELVSAPGLAGEMDKPAYIFGLISTALQGVGLRTTKFPSHFNLENDLDLRTSNFLSHFNLEVSHFNLENDLDLRTSNFLSNFNLENDLAESSTGLSDALSDIRKALEEACQSHNLPFAQTWTPRSGENQSYLGDVHVLVTSSDEYYLSHARFSLLRDTCESFQLLRGRGVVWRAFSSGNPCFCRDIAMLSIAEYSFAHVARKVLLDSSFAICLRSDHMAETVYVLELFLPFKTADPRPVLESILLTMKKHLNGFRLASGKQLGDEMHVEVLSVSKDDKPDFFRLFNIADGSVELQDHHISPTHQQLFSDNGTCREFSTIDNARITADEEQEPLESFDLKSLLEDDASVSRSSVTVNNDLIGWKEDSSDTRTGKDVSNYINSSASTSRFPDKDCQLNENFITDPKVDSFDTKAGGSSASELERINREVVEKHFNFKLKDAARILKVSPSTLKRKCRKFGIPSWPRKKNQATCSTTSIESNKGNDKHSPEYGLEGLNSNMSTEDGTTSSKQNTSQATTVTSGSLMMTIKAAYGEKIIIKFQIPFFSSQLADMEMEVASRLKLKPGDFNIWYLDEDDDWILLTCDADLRTMESMGKTTTRVSITHADAATS